MGGEKYSMGKKRGEKSGFFLLAGEEQEQVVKVGGELKLGIFEGGGEILLHVLV